MTAEASTVGTSHESPSVQRTLLSYLLIPRPHDLVKGLMIAVPYVVGVLGFGEFGAESACRAFIVILAVELLIYAARYQWNDIRGFRSDQQHPDCVARGRLPGPLSKEQSRKTTSLAVAVARMVVVVLLAMLVPGLNLGTILAWSVAGVFGAAFLYESLRRVVTGRTDDDTRSLRPAVVALWFVVGAGYAVRGLIGLGLAIDITAYPGLAAVATVTFWAYGVAFVMSRWAVEATAFAQSYSGTIVWSASASQAREHQIALARWLPDHLSSFSPGDGERTAIRNWAPLSDRTSLLAPWNIAMIVAGAGAAVTGYAVAGGAISSLMAPFALLGAVLAFAVVTVPRRQRLISVATGSVVLGIPAVTLEVPSPVVVALPWLLLMGAYLFFSTRTLAKLERGGPIRISVVQAIDWYRRRSASLPPDTETIDGLMPQTRP